MNKNPKLISILKLYKKNCMWTTPGQYSPTKNELNKYDGLFSLKKNQFKEIFEKRNNYNEFIFVLNQCINTIKSKLKNYKRANVN